MINLSMITRETTYRPEEGHQVYHIFDYSATQEWESLWVWEVAPLVLIKQESAFDRDDTWWLNLPYCIGSGVGARREDCAGVVEELRGGF
jgi:hypothetical protein